jgi:hypothetical protein
MKDLTLRKALLKATGAEAVYLGAGHYRLAVNGRTATWKMGQFGRVRLPVICDLAGYARTVQQVIDYLLSGSIHCHYARQ